MRDARSDVESGEAAAPAPGRLRKSPGQLFIMLACLSLVWLASLLYMVHDLQPREHVRQQLNVDYAGGDIDSIYGIRSVADCRSECERHPRCLAYTYVVAEKACWLKGMGYSAKPNTNTISGGINATLAEERRRAYNGTHFVGDEYFSQPWLDRKGYDEGESYGDMHQRERRFGEEDGDEGDVFDGRRSFDDRFHDRFDDRYDSVPRETTAEELEHYNDSTTYFGDITVLTDIRAADECNANCHSDGRCVAWTHDKARSLCLLRLLNASSVRYSPDFISGTLGADEIAERAARLLGGAAGGGGGGGNGSAPRRREQREEEGEDEEALLQTSVYPQRTRELYRGPAWALPAELLEASDNVDLRGGDIRELEDVDSVAGCRAACEAAAGPPRCAAWTLSKRQRLCFLKTANFTRLAMNKSDALISGVLRA